MKTTTQATELLKLKFSEVTFTEQSAQDGIPTLWLPLDKLRAVLTYLKTDIDQPYPLLFDITAIDERTRKKSPDYPSENFTLVYHLFSFDRNAFLRLKIALKGEFPTVPSI